MILNLDRFQADMPYPKMMNVQPDKELACKLLDGYSGKSSELTTVLQYAYHSLQCKRHSHEIASIIHGIFYVETLHMELLGEIIARLGGETYYNLGANRHSECWQASLVDYASEPSAILKADMDGEKHAVDFYMESAKTCGQPDIARLLLRLAEDEKLHYHIFSDMYRSFMPQRM